MTEVLIEEMCHNSLKCTIRKTEMIALLIQKDITILNPFSKLGISNAITYSV